MQFVRFPFDHEYALNPAGTHSCSVPPLHLDGGPVMLTEGEAYIVMACAAVAVHPLAALTVTVYVPEDAGLVHVVVSPFDHALLL
jgi:hypothetical protein